MRYRSRIPLLALAAVLLCPAGLSTALATESAGKKVYGVVRGRVIENLDPEGKSRLRVERRSGKEWIESGWAHVVVPMVSPEAFELPDVGDEVLLAFESGDLRRPVVLGTLWNAGDRP